MCVFNFALPIAACPRLRRGWRPCLSAFALHSQAPGFLDTVGRGAPLRFLRPRVIDVRAAFLTHLICNVLGSGRSLPYSPGTGKTWLPSNGHSLISQAPEESKILLPPGLGQWRRPGALCLQAQGCTPLAPSPAAPGPPHLGRRACAFAAHPLLSPPPCLTRFSELRPHSEPTSKPSSFQKSISSPLKRHLCFPRSDGPGVGLPFSSLGVRTLEVEETPFRVCVLRQVIQMTKIKSLGAYGSFDFKHEAS